MKSVIFNAFLRRASGLDCRQEVSLERTRIPSSPPLIYRPAPGPQVIKRWEAYRRWLEYDHLQRSPLDRENTLDYMLRTFW